LLSCAGGCCDGDGNCQPGDDRDVCGLGASSCENCVVACFAGQCLPF
jgi:hypothetical protein